MSFDLDEINRRAKDDPENFIRECEERYEAQIIRAADHIVENSKKSSLVLLSGPSASGKTTTSKKIEAEIRKRGIMTHAVGMDSYFKTVDPNTAPRTPEGNMDFESPECVDFPLMQEHFRRFMKGHPVAIPQYNFASQKREKEPAFIRYPTGRDIVIVEGIHALGDMAIRAFPEAFRVYISPSSDILKDGEMVFFHTWMRMVRRIVRDNLFRGTAPEYTLNMWENVRRGEILYIRPNKKRAELTFDTAFAYELCALKSCFLPLIENAPDYVRKMSDVQKVLDALSQFESIDPKLVPPESLLREFIGGGIYEY